jgi:heme exporter protein C
MNILMLPYRALDSLSRYVTPARFLSFSGVVLPWLWGLAGVLAAAGLYLGFLASPGDYQQGETVRIMYIHVPAAWLAMMAYTFIFLSSVGGLIFRNPLADVSAKVAAPIGAAFTLQALITGSIWGKPTWGTYWAWDARLTSFLILFLLYLGLIALWNSIEDQARAGRAAAILAIVGSVNIPIIHYSVEWWNTLHQGASVFRLDGPKIAAVFLWPLLIMAIAFTVLFFALHLTAMRSEILRRRVAGMRARRAEDATVPVGAATMGRTV